MCDFYSTRTADIPLKEGGKDGKSERAVQSTVPTATQMLRRSSFQRSKLASSGMSTQSNIIQHHKLTIPNVSASYFSSWKPEQHSQCMIEEELDSKLANLRGYRIGAGGRAAELNWNLL